MNFLCQSIPLKGNPYSDFYHYCLVLPVLKCPIHGITQCVLLCASTQHFVSDTHPCCWLSLCVLFGYYYLDLGSSRPTIALLSVFQVSTLSHLGHVLCLLYSSAEHLQLLPQVQEPGLRERQAMDPSQSQHLGAAP